LSATFVSVSLARLSFSLPSTSMNDLRMRLSAPRAPSTRSSALPTPSTTSPRLSGGIWISVSVSAAVTAWSSLTSAVQSSALISAGTTRGSRISFIKLRMRRPFCVSSGCSRYAFVRGSQVSSTNSLTGA
jgi:hypothetical protein